MSWNISEKQRRKLDGMASPYLVLLWLCLHGSSGQTLVRIGLARLATANRNSSSERLELLVEWLAQLQHRRRAVDIEPATDSELVDPSVCCVIRMC